MSLRGSVVLVTGGSGFLGRALLKRLSGSCRVVALARDPDRAQDAPGIDWIAGDLRTGLGGMRLPQRVHAVVHLASVREPSDGAGPEELFAVNAGVTAALVEYAVRAGARRFVYGSTGGVCGYRTARIRESTPAAPFDWYTLSKWHGETIVGTERRLSHAVVRYFFPYGPGQRAGIIPRLAVRLQTGQPVVLYRRGRVPHLNPVYVDDAADLTQLVVRSSVRGIVNSAGPDVVTVRELGGRMAAVLGVTPSFTHGRDPRVGDMVASLALGARVLGFRPHVALDVGLQRTLKGGA